jgi:hypothetical protein
MRAAIPLVSLLFPLTVCTGDAESAAADWPRVLGVRGG